MYIPLSANWHHQKRQTGVSPNSDTLIPNVDNKLGLMVGVGLAIAAILALLLGALIKRSRLRRSKSKSEPPPAQTQIETRQTSFSPGRRPSSARSDITESTLCGGSPIDSPKAIHVHVPRPPSVLAAPQTLVPPFGSRSPSLSLATTTSQDRASSWECVAQRLDEKGDARDPKRTPTASERSTLSSPLPSPRMPTSLSSPIDIPSPVSLKDNKRHIYGGI